MDRIECAGGGGGYLSLHYSAPVLEDTKRNVVLYMQGTAQFSPTHVFENIKDAQTGNETQVLRIKGMPVFRSGSFKDSMGELKTWETLHIDQMASSFQFLKEQNVFPEVPVREGHGSFFGDPMTGLVGYHDALHTVDAQAPDGETYRYLIADFSIYKPEHQQAYLSGLWRNRSAEVGYYESNNGTGYYPVYQGFAFVDIPAVQYLNLFSQNKQRSFSVLLEKEIPMTAPAATPPAAPQTVPPAGSAAPNSGGDAPQGQPNSQHSAPATTPSNPPAPTTPPPTPTPNPAPPVVPGAPMTFACGGQQVSDFAAVQSYITKLEGDVNSLNQFRTDQVRAGRVNYVKQLATDKKILASQIGNDKAGEESGLIKLVVGMDDASFGMWREAYDNLPVNPLFAHQASGGSQNPEADQDPEVTEYEKVKAQVEWHRASRMLDADLANTSSYKRMAELATKLGKPGPEAVK